MKKKSVESRVEPVSIKMLSFIASILVEDVPELTVVERYDNAIDRFY